MNKAEVVFEKYAFNLKNIFKKAPKVEKVVEDAVKAEKNRWFSIRGKKVDKGVDKGVEELKAKLNEVINNNAALKNFVEDNSKQYSKKHLYGVGAGAVLGGAGAGYVGGSFGTNANSTYQEYQ